MPEPFDSRHRDYLGPPYRGATSRSFYVTMRDGVRIAVDLFLPKGLRRGERVPALLVQTRYWRATGMWPGLGWLGKRLLTPAPLTFLARHGYAVLYLDVRGTGASFGSQRYPWDREEVADNKDLVDWVVSQPWSNGRVGGYGTSYDGTAAELLTTVNHPAVRAVVVRFNETDGYSDIAFPGGVYLKSFMHAWAEANRQLDSNRVDRRGTGPVGALLAGVKPVDADWRRSLLRGAVRDHARNLSVGDLCDRVTYRDDVDPNTGIQLSDFNVASYRQQIERSGAAVYGWGGWFDACTANSVLRRVMTLGNPQLAIIGPWNHGATYNSSPYGGGPEPVTQHMVDALRFFDHHLNGADNGMMDLPRITYYTLGEERWKSTNVWPPPGVTMRRWYLGAESGLVEVPPDTDSGEDEYEVDWEATTGTSNRWHTEMDRCPVVYPDRAAADRRLLTYTSLPLAEDIEITGHPTVSLQVSSSHTDGAFFVYLEEVDADGHVTYLTEGQLRALHRRISSDPPPFAVFGPYHSFEEKDGQLLEPGCVTELAFALQPISVRLSRGRRLRVAIACADKDTFSRVPVEGTPTISVHRSRAYASYIDLPMAPVGGVPRQ